MEVIGYTPPCQSFSGSNRDVDHNSEKDLYRKNLSVQFVDAMKTSGAPVGIFENVEGMWRRPNIYFLKKIVFDLLVEGFQVRVRLHRANFFGDPQARPRLIMYVAKKFVEMPNVLETHGPGKHPFVTVGNAFKSLEKALARMKSSDDVPIIPNLQGSNMTKPDKDEDILKANKPAITIRCGGRAWHPWANRAITVREAAILQGYPNHYKFLGSLTDQYKQVGNSVPGGMARAIGLAVKESLRFVYDEELEEEEGQEETVESLISEEDNLGGKDNDGDNGDNDVNMEKVSTDDDSSQEVVDSLANEGDSTPNDDEEKMDESMDDNGDGDDDDGADTKNVIFAI